MSLKDKTAIVTGGTSGIGLATVEELLKNGISKILVIDLKDSLDKVFRTYLKQFNKNAEIFYAKCDVSKKSDIEQTFRKLAIRKLGSIDILVNAAGIFKEDNPDMEIAVNLGGTVNCTLTAIDLMSKDKTRPGRAIVNISSLAGLDPVAHAAVYCATKFGVVGFTRSLGEDSVFNKTGVRAMVICPGATFSSMVKDPLQMTATFPWLQPSLQKYVACAKFQEATVVGKCVVRALLEGTAGSVWVCMEDRIRQVQYEESKFEKLFQS
ncbi:alcohol dehydrogenase 1-like [Uranotaenia lowii]|uniref:alcohol dehydrogenase 1-like n=1 Tax=Uranotaenia lowii TaxID=190385 RepID=UPI0024791B26|nr:alcohol dehydrogenase 1-like [Uranotaenia lowii]